MNPNPYPGYVWQPGPNGTQVLVPQNPGTAQQWQPMPAPQPQQPMYQPQPQPPQWGPAQPQGYGPQGGFMPQPAPPGPPTQVAPVGYQPTDQAPRVYIPSQAEFDALYQQSQQQKARQEAQRGAKSMKFLGPNGETKWDGVPQGFARSIIWRMLPSPIQGVNYFLEKTKHFWFSARRPQGAGGWCPGPGCRVCAAVEIGLGSQNDGEQKKAKVARAQVSRLYQGLQYGDVERNRREDGRVHPQPFDCPVGVHLDLMSFIATRPGGLASFLDLSRGTPFQLTKKKTGPEKMNVDYSVIDMPQYAGPLPRELGYGPNGEGLQLLDLRQFTKSMDDDEQRQAVEDLQIATGQQYSYQQQPQAPSAPPAQWQQPQAQQTPATTQYAYAQGGNQAPLPAVSSAQPPVPTGWQGQQPPVLPTTGQPAPESYAPPRVDPWSQQAMDQPPAIPPGYQGPAAQAAPPWAASTQPQGPQDGPGAWAAQPPPAPAPQPDPRVQAMQQAMAGPGPAFPPPPVPAPPGR